MIAGTSASWYCMPASVQDLQREERGADRRAEQHRERGRHPRDRQAPRLDRVRAPRTRANQLASVPHVVTSGASGPAAPPAEIVMIDIGTSDRSERTSARRPTRGCCRRAARRRPDCRARARSTATSNADAAEHHELLRAPLKCSRRQDVLQQVDREEVRGADRTTARCRRATSRRGARASARA